MTKTTQRYDESFTIPADATRERVASLFTDAVFAISDSGADIDWANLGVSSERKETYEQTMQQRYPQLVEEYTTVTLTARGRK